MSFPERQVSLSLDAQDDLTDILLHRLQEWGEEQGDRFAATFERAIDELAQYPEIGERRTDLSKGCRARLISPYIVYYQVWDNTIEIVRILHEKTDPSRHLRA